MKISLEEFVRRGMAAQKAVDDLGAGKPKPSTEEALALADELADWALSCKATFPFTKQLQKKARAYQAKRKE